MSKRDAIDALIDDAAARVDAAAQSLSHALEAVSQAERRLAGAHETLRAHDAQTLALRRTNAARPGLRAADLGALDARTKARGIEREAVAAAVREAERDVTNGRALVATERDALAAARAQKLAYEKHRDARAREQLRIDERKAEDDPR